MIKLLYCFGYRYDPLTVDEETIANDLKLFLEEEAVVQKWPSSYTLYKNGPLLEDLKDGLVEQNYVVVTENES